MLPALGSHTNYSFTLCGVFIALAPFSCSCKSYNLGSKKVWADPIHQKLPQLICSCLSMSWIVLGHLMTCWWLCCSCVPFTAVTAWESSESYRRTNIVCLIGEKSSNKHQSVSRTPICNIICHTTKATFSIMELTSSSLCRTLPILSSCYENMCPGKIIYMVLSLHCSFRKMAHTPLDRGLIWSSSW